MTNYKDLQQLMKMQGEIPNKQDIQNTIDIINIRLKYSAMDKEVNKPVKDGYLLALHVLRNNIRDFNKLNTKGINNEQSLAIAAIAVDYLNGYGMAVTLFGVPIKE